jgi:hypothetical protein
MENSMTERCDFFISLAHRDGLKLAEDVAEIVRELGLKPYIGLHEPTPNPLEDTVREQIDHCRYVVVILTNDAIASKWVRSEVQYSLERKTIIVVKSRPNIRIPEGLSRCTQIDRRQLREGLEKLVGIPVIVPTGGAGRRLSPITENMPKSLLPVGDKPLLEWILESFAPSEFSKATILVQRYESMIRHWVSRFQHKIPVDYFSSDINSSLVDSLLRINPSREFLLHVCDVLPHSPSWKDLISTHRERARREPAIGGTLLVSPKYHLPVGASTRSTYRPEFIEAFFEKPEAIPQIDINKGIAIFTPSFLDYVRAQQPTLVLTTPFEYVQHAVRHKELLFSFLPHRSEWKHIQNVADWYDAQREHFDERGQGLPDREHRRQAGPGVISDR